MEIARATDFKIILTGTPMPNGYEDLFSLTTILSPDRALLPFNYNQLKNFTAHEATEEQEKRIMESIYPYYSRVSKKYLMNRGELLPPKYNVRWSKMSEEQRLIYDFLDGIIVNLENKWESEFNMVLIKAILIRKMQVSANPKLLNKTLLASFDELMKEIFAVNDELNLNDEDIQEMKNKFAIADKEINNQINTSDIGKLIKKYSNNELVVNKNQLAIDLVKEIIGKNQKVILWDVFVGNMETLKSLIFYELKIKASIINGEVTGEDRQKVIDDFRNGSLKVLIASPATLAESISLHKCCQNSIYVNKNYNAAQFIQSKDRIHRINMPEGTTANYYFLMNLDSVDEAVSERLDKKEKRMLRILDSDNIIIGDLESLDNSTLSNDDVLESYKR
jgi:hypothetical protein